MKTLGIIAAVLVSGAAYGQTYEDMTQRLLREGNEQLQQLQAQETARIQHEQLEEIQLQQRQIRYDLERRELFRENRIQEEQRYLRNLIEDCE